jgi:hypothetical protein
VAIAQGIQHQELNTIGVKDIQPLFVPSIARYGSLILRHALSLHGFRQGETPEGLALPKRMSQTYS